MTLNLSFKLGRAVNLTPALKIGQAVNLSGSRMPSSLFRLTPSK